MFNKHTETRVEKLICGELRTAKEQHGEKFNSLHEAYAVALEELEEASEKVNMAKYRYEDVWNRIKWNAELKRMLKIAVEDIDLAMSETVCAICSRGCDVSTPSIWQH